ncbi:MAG: DNA-directed RNA polymerase subunit omega [Armatimonadota bacterium]
MIYPSADKLEKLGSKYGLVVLAAKRAKQIKSGVRPLINTDSRNPLTIALEEIAAGKITCEIPDTDIIAPIAHEPEVAQLLAIPGRTEEDDELEAGAAEEETTLTLEDKEVSVDDIDELDELEVDDTEDEEEPPLILGLDDDEEEEIEPVPEPSLDDELGLDIKPKSKRKSKADIDVDLDIDIDIDEDIVIDEDDEEPSED